MIEKTCKACGITKEITEFAKKSSGKYGVKTICKNCINEASRQLTVLGLNKKRTTEQNRKFYIAKMDRETHEQRIIRIEKDKIRHNKKRAIYNQNRNIVRSSYPEAFRKRQREYYHSNKDKEQLKQADYRERNRDKERERVKKWREENPDICSIQMIEKVARKQQATPAWSNLEEIKEIYKECRKISNETGILHHVDHIVPLKGKNVHGLHVPYNLRIVPAVENLKKRNKLIEDII